MKTLPPELERAKGFFRFAKGPELQEFQYAPPGNATIAPITLLDEPSHAIVLIGRGYDQEDGCAQSRTCLSAVLDEKPPASRSTSTEVA